MASTGPSAGSGFSQPLSSPTSIPGTYSPAFTSVFTTHAGSSSSTFSPTSPVFTSIPGAGGMHHYSSPVVSFRQFTEPVTTAPLHYLGSPFSYLPPPSQGFSLPPSVGVKLDRDNYLLWRYTILPTLRGHRLESHLLSPVPPPEVTSPTAVSEWQMVDQLLLGWLLGTMTRDPLTDVVGCNTSYKVWQTLETLYNSQSQAKVLEFKHALSTTYKLNRSIAEYMAVMKGFADNLAAAGYPVSNPELILDVLRGLPKTFESIIVNITYRVHSLTWADVQAQLTTHESMLARFDAQAGSLDLNPPTALLAQARDRGHYNNQFPNARGRQGNPNRGRGRGRGGGHNASNTYSSSSQDNNTKPKCQICWKVGHAAIDCWHRYEENFVPQPKSNSQKSKQMAAYLASQDVSNDASWVADSGASNHITVDLGNLSSRSEYEGSSIREGVTGRNPGKWPLQDPASPNQ